MWARHMKLRPSLNLFLGTFFGFGLGFFLGLWIGYGAMQEQIDAIRAKNAVAHISGYIIIVPIGYSLSFATVGGLLGAGILTILNRTMKASGPTQD
ncbi:MAG TPA: hypothetical protein PLN21_03970 [Gemmatales bacterium]|nr:hypothetical protein [Gemmatales bacterium]